MLNSIVVEGLKGFGVISINGLLLSIKSELLTAVENVASWAKSERTNELSAAWQVQ